MIERLNRLTVFLDNIPSFGVAFSGGVDSTFLAAVAKKVCGTRAVALTAVTSFMPENELEQSVKMAKHLGIKHILVNVNLMEENSIVINSRERCYFCKEKLFTALGKEAKRMGLKRMIHGVNTDDLNDFRPGLKACKKMGVLSPFVDADIDKNFIRVQSRKMGLETWNFPSQSCLATRIPYGELITQDKLDRIEACERYLFEFGGVVGSRVRCHGDLARIECTLSDMDKMVSSDFRKQINLFFKQNGFKYVSLDMGGYVSGNMNR